MHELRRRVMQPATVILLFALLGAPGDAIAGYARAMGSGASTGGQCVTVPRGAHVPGILLAGFPLHGLVADDASGHLFVLSGGMWDAQNRLQCRTSVFMLNERTGRLERRVPIGHGSGPGTYQGIAVHSAAHRLFAVETGDFSVDRPANPGSISVLDTVSGRVLKTIGGGHPGAVVVDNHTYRAFVPVHLSPPATGGGVEVIAVTRGQVVRTVPVPGDMQDLAVDQTANRVYVLGMSGVTTLDGATGAVIATVPLTAGFHQYNGYGLDEATGRLFVTQVGLAPPHAGLPGNPPNVLTVIDAVSGAVLRTIEASAGFLTGHVLVDAPAHTVLSWTNNTTSTEADVLDPHDGRVLHRIALPAPPGGISGPVVVDPVNGTLYAFAYTDVYALHPGSWRRGRTYSHNTLTTYSVAFSAHTHRLFSIEIDLPVARYGTVLRSYCVPTSCA